MKKIFFVLLFNLSNILSREREIIHLEEGNLSLPTSQQPNPLFCFGQNIVDKGDLQIQTLFGDLKGKNKNFKEIIPFFLYGISNELSIYIGAPVAAKFKLNNCCNSGIEDIFTQFEYAFFNRDHLTYATEATLVANMTFPTGSIKKDPPLGLGSPSFFVGLTASRTSIDWYLFVDSGAVLTTQKNNTKFGDRFLYQGGIGKNINYISQKRIVTLIVEFFGAYTKRDKICGIIDQNSGGNSFSIGPNIWISTQKFFFEAGIAFPVLQPKNILNKNKYLFVLQLGWKFN